MMDLAKFRVETVATCGVEVDEVYYVPEFVSVEEEAYLMRKVRWCFISLAVASTWCWMTLIY